MTGERRPGHAPSRQPDRIASIARIIQEVEPDEVPKLGGQSFAQFSWQQPLMTGQVRAIGVSNMPKALRIVAPKAHFYRVSSSEMSGPIEERKQSKKTLFFALASPYAVAKLCGHWRAVNYR